MGWTGRRLTYTLIAVLVLCVVIGGGSAFVIGRQQHAAVGHGGTVQEPSSGSETSTPESAGTRSGAGTSSGSASGAASQSIPIVSTPARSETGRLPSSAGTVEPPQTPSQDVSVQLSPQALQSPRAEEVRQLLQRYFDAINTRDYDVWVSAVSTPQSSSRPKDEWEQSYSSTHDSQIRVVNIFDDTLQVRLWFISQQDVSLAPADLPVPCISWDVTYQLVERDGSLVVGNSVPSALNKVACG